MYTTTGKQASEQVFDTFDATDLNQELKSLMDGLSVKVFRTYNASVTLDRLLHETQYEPTDAEDLVARKADYDRANKEVTYYIILLFGYLGRYYYYFYFFIIVNNLLLTIIIYRH